MSHVSFCPLLKLDLPLVREKARLLRLLEQPWRSVPALLTQSVLTGQSRRLSSRHTMAELGFAPLSDKNSVISFACFPEVSTSTYEALYSSLASSAASVASAVCSRNSLCAQVVY